MSKADTSYMLRRLSRFGSKPDYKQKLQRPPEVASIDTDTSTPCAVADQVKALTRHAEAGSISFQSVAVTVLRLLQQVEQVERQAAAAASSLGLQEKLAMMVATTHATVEALRTAVSEKGAQMIDINPSLHEQDATDADEESSWWFALTEAIQAIEQAIECTRALVAGQPRGGPTRTLGTAVTRLLHAHHADLLAEAEQWMA